MYAGKTLFAQVMDFLPWTTFERIVHRGIAGIIELECSRAWNNFE
jgi:hypothetical protein